MRGNVINGLEAVASIEVLAPDLGHVKVLAIIDTGCTCDLTLPTSAIRDLGLPLLRLERATLADDSTITVEIYQGSVVWLGQIRNIEVVQTEGTPLLGMHLMQNCRLTIDIVPDGEFEIISLEEIQE